MPRPIKRTNSQGDSPDQITTTIRLPADLRRQLEAAAADQTRNLSQEIERRLQRSFSPEALFVDSVAALEGQEAHKKIADYLHSMAAEVHGNRAASGGLALMRLISGSEIYGEHFVPHPGDMELCRIVLADLEHSIKREKPDGVRSKDPRDDQALLPMSAQQVRDAMASRFASGEWKNTIPEAIDLAIEFGVSWKTMDEALALMEAEGFIRLIEEAPSKRATKSIALVAARPGDKGAGAKGAA